MPPSAPKKPTLPPTKPATLFVAALAAAAIGLLLVTRFYGDMPGTPWFAGVSLLIVAAACAITAQTTRARIERRPGTRPVEALSVARYAAFAKACSLGGALFAGYYAAFLVYVIAQRGRLQAAADDLVPTAVSFAGALALVAAALWLERACRIPKNPDDDEDDDSHGAPAADH
ncbi:membrane protein [Actinorhabdospora filicis]|uniref:Membrane protein n=1 Tax=Actinorhabdospora filicis TaxID=1785913 RepID=A0A9W6SQM4_9ACTN|nr:DUF3180 domain-containing protein [Actinorhabdospora filicis]GLZ80568.1 membrane protein [Actinorhabdospora filicis]